MGEVGDGYGRAAHGDGFFRKHADGNVTSPILLPDYAGGFDHGLTELADVLPPEVYQL